MLFDPLDGILGTAAKVRIIRVLLPLLHPVSGRDAQRLARIRSRSSAATALDDLVATGVLRRVEIRGSHLYEINEEHDLVPGLLQLFRREEGRRSAFVASIRQGLTRQGLEDHVHSLVLYGSNARGEAKPGSDVDLLVVVDAEAAVTPVLEGLYEAGGELARMQGLRISPYALSVERMRERARDGDPLMETIRKEGRVLMGKALDELVTTW